ncbi:nuclear GTPase SLIP-GC-like protein [Labeo rohita]|uniref:Nuclear GTPase SLIP-GC-like protein n=1 Tax=Labeo rohita TaxID=84645 RepID=A0A498LX13_LABRO|nr:nuclear GTPase SLIP-GC-like protein [Labeo rohita]
MPAIPPLFPSFSSVPRNTHSASMPPPAVPAATFPPQTRSPFSLASATPLSVPPNALALEPPPIPNSIRTQILVGADVDLFSLLELHFAVSTAVAVPAPAEAPFSQFSTDAAAPAPAGAPFSGSLCRSSARSRRSSILRFPLPQQPPLPQELYSQVETKGIVHKNLEENLAKALKELGCEFDSLYKIINQCLSKGVGKSVELCVDTKNKMIESVAPNDRRGFHKTLQALYKNKGRYWPKNWDAPLDLNMCLAKHMHDNINAEFNLIFPVDDSKTGMSVQEGIDKFSIIQSDTAYSSSSMLYHMENFIKAEEDVCKTLESELKRSVERSLSQTTKTTLMDVSSEIEMLEAAIWKLSD